jgi:RimJ/RimL family protein N-acetyltransferase
MDPLLIDVPARICTERFVLRCPRPGDGAELNAAILESLDELRPWSPWAQQAPTLGESESYVRLVHGRFALRTDLQFHVRERIGDDEGALLGAIGLPRLDWTVPRFEIGYWRRTGARQRGVMTEAVLGLTRLAFDVLHAERVEIRTDATNTRSARVAERAGYTLEGVLRRERRTVNGDPCDTRVYARVRGVEEQC